MGRGTVAGGYQLTLRLDAPAPMRASLPLLAVDAVPLGVAEQSTDRRRTAGTHQPGRMVTG